MTISDYSEAPRLNDDSLHSNDAHPSRAMVAFNVLSFNALTVFCFGTVVLLLRGLHTRANVNIHSAFALVNLFASTMAGLIFLIIGLIGVGTLHSHLLPG